MIPNHLFCGNEIKKIRFFATKIKDENNNNFVANFGFDVGGLFTRDWRASALLEGVRYLTVPGDDNLEEIQEAMVG